MNGYEVCAALKQDEAMRKIPILMLTAKAQRQDQEEGLKHGADAFLTKPFQLDELLAKARTLLGGVGPNGAS
jgi:DNA-binding response OmpR family regulator